MIKAVIFDCDGVLVDSEVIAHEVEMLTLGEIGLTYDSHDFKARFMGMSDKAFHAALEADGQARLGRSIIEEIRPRIQVSRPVAAGRFRPEEPAMAGVRLGGRVRHGKFGEGVILNVEGNGSHARVQVSFESQGTKWLMAEYLEPL